MAQVEDHVARNLSQLPDFGVELSSMEFTSVRAFSQTLKCLLESWKKKFKCDFLFICPFFKKICLSCGETSGWTGW
jgi:hypothetical protein